MKTKLTPLIGIAISLAFVGLLLYSLHLDQVAQALSTADYWWLLPAVTVSLSSFIWRAQRFRRILAPLSHFSLITSYQYIAINYMANNVLPARAGEAFLSYVVKQRQGIPFSSSLAVTLLGRVIDGLLLLICLLITISLLPFPAWIIQILTIGFIIFGLVMASLVALVLGTEEQLSWISRQLKQKLPSWTQRAIAFIISQLQKFRQGLLPLKSKRLLLQTALSSLAIWFCEGLVYFLVGQAFNLPLSLAAWVFVVSLSNLATSIPSGPAGIGTFHGVVVISLGLMAIDPNLAAAYAVILHITQVVPITLVGALAYFRHHASHGLGLSSAES